jgi:tRNA wybutosine-synthesizing protein 3
VREREERFRVLQPLSQLNSGQAMASFDDRKHAVLQGLASDAKDKSRAGGVDAPIAPLVARINCHSSYCTTSSCSGRVSVFSESDPDDGGGAPSVGKKTRTKKGGDWVYVSHETAVEGEVSNPGGAHLLLQLFV